MSLVGAVGVAWGLVTSAGLETDARSGFSPIKFDALGGGGGLYIQSTSVCAAGDSIFYTNSNTVWEKGKDGQVSIYAGGPGLRPVLVPEDLSDRLKIRFTGRLSIGCGKNYVVVADIDQHRLVAIPNIGPAIILAGKVSSDGIPEANFSGDGGPSHLAAINLTFPGSGVAVVEGSLGDTIYFADTANHRIRRITPDGKISTIAGTGIVGASPDGTSAKDAPLDLPQNIAVAANGELYFTSVGVFENPEEPKTKQYFASVRKIDTLGKLATIVGLSDSLEPTKPGSIFALPDQNPDYGEVTPFVSVAVAPDNSIFVGVSRTQNVVRISDTDKSLVFAPNKFLAPTIPENSIEVLMPTLSPYGISIEPTTGNLLVASGVQGATTSIYSINKVGITRAIGGYHFAAKQGLARSVFLKIDSLALDSMLNIFAVHEDSLVLKANTSATPANLFSTEIGCRNDSDGGCSPLSSATSGPLPAPLMTAVEPTKVAVDRDGSVFFTEEKHIVMKRSTQGVLTKVAGTIAVSGFSGNGNLATAAKLSHPHGIAIGSDGLIFIADTGNNQIRVIDPKTNKISAFAGITTRPALASGVTPNGDGGLATSAWIESPKSIAVATETVGGVAKNVVYFVESEPYNRIRKIDSNNVVTTVLGTDAQIAVSDDLDVYGASTVTMANTLNQPTKFEVANYQPVEGTGVALSTLGSLGTGFVSGKTYYVHLPVTDKSTKITRFQLSSTVGGAGIKGTGKPSGTHTIVSNQVKLVNPDEIAVGLNGDLYVIDHPATGDRLSLMSKNAGAVRFKTLVTANGETALFKTDGAGSVTTGRSCSVGNKSDSVTTTRDDLMVKVQTSMSQMCSGAKITHVATGNTCDPKKPSEGTFSLVFAQTFYVPDVRNALEKNTQSQVIQMKMPCPVAP